MSILNRAYLRDEGRCFGPVFFPGEEYNFFINALISDPGFANFRLDIKNIQTNALTQNIAPLEKIQFDPVNYNIRATFTIPVLVFGWYRLQIYDTVAAVVKAESNNLQIEESAKVSNTALLTYRHSFNKFGFNYEQDPNWLNKVRYPLIHAGFQIEKDVKQYRNAHNQRLRNLESFKDEVYKIQSYHFNEEGHRSISSIYDHDTLFVNLTSVTPKTAYVIEENLRSDFSNGSVDVVVNKNVPAPGSIISQVREFSDEWSDEFS